jgi:CRISPR/Cas system-associated exonuclease Cas4 (RecB family)
MDNIFKKYFDQYRETGTLPPEISGKVEGRLFSDMEKLNVWREINFGRGGMRAEFPEYGIILAGAIDELLVGPDGKYIPFDFKTRGYATKEDTHEHYRHQLDLYALLFQKQGFAVADFGYLLFFWPEEYKNHSASFKTELVKMDISPERGKEVLKEVQAIVSGPMPPGHGDCEFCVYRRIDE